VREKHTRTIPRGERGAAMLAALCLAMVFAIALSSYVALCYVSLSTSTRNVVNEHALELAEAGIEQALYYNNNDLSGWNVATAGGITTVSTQMTMTSSGLQPTSGGPTPLNYGNGATGLVNISYSYPAGQPTAIQSITSQGVMTLPTGTVTAGTGPTISRTLTYTGSSLSTTAAAPLFVNAVAATSGVLKFKTGGTLDSYNSNPSATGLYKGSICVIASVGTTNWRAIGDPNTTPAIGDVFTATGPGTGTGTAYENYNGAYVTGSSPPYINDGFSAVVLSADTTSSTATVKLMDAVVHGYAVGYDYSSPSTTNWLSYGSSGQLVGPSTPGGTDIDSSRILTSPVPNQPIFPVTPPASTPTILGAVTTAMTLGSSSATTIQTVYQTSSITLSGTTMINVVSPVVIVSKGAISISGTTAGIYLTTKSASLQIIHESGAIALGAYGITNSNTIGTTGIPPLPKRVAILSSSGTAGLTLSMTTPFYGEVFFPSGTITVSSDALIYGSLVGSAVSITGAAPAIHYDNALRSPDTTVGDAAFANISAPMTVSSLLASVP
jgi:hypothetical protein